MKYSAGACLSETLTQTGHTRQRSMSLMMVMIYVCNICRSTAQGFPLQTRRRKCRQYRKSDKGNAFSCLFRVGSHCWSSFLYRSNTYADAGLSARHQTDRREESVGSWLVVFASLVSPGSVGRVNSHPPSPPHLSLSSKGMCDPVMTYDLFNGPPEQHLSFPTIPGPFSSQGKLEITGKNRGSFLLASGTLVQSTLSLFQHSGFVIGAGLWHLR